MRTPCRRKTLAAWAFALLVAAAAPAAIASAAEPEKGPKNPHGSYVEACEMCHAPDAWTPVRISPKFNHAKFGFPLEAAHAQSDCRACHTSLDFSKAKPKSTCVACHEDIHQGELGQDCSRCHSSRSFIDRARMVHAHNVTRFPLTGAHLSADCEACHKPAAQGHLTYVNLKIDCQACHLDDYNATTNPNHAASSIPRECMQCHTTIAWLPAKFANHDAQYFRIYSGRHLGQWTSCADCHISPSNYMQFECILCHAHSNQASVTTAHALVSGFQYNSQACYSCHSKV